MASKAWVIAVSMGYGHQRTAYPLRHLAPGGRVINVNDYKGIPEKDKRLWEKMKGGYEYLSRIRAFPIIGKKLFAAFDELQKILTFYPKRDLSEPNLQLRETLFPIKKFGLGKHLIARLSSEPLPFVTTFFTPAFMAEHFNYPGEIYCVVCDTDISRTWAPPKPQDSKIKYFAPTPRVVERLKLYGVRPENIYFTGYPLPLENIGGEGMEILKEDLKIRLLNLDPRGEYCKKYKVLVENKLGSLPENSGRPLTVTFAVGGAGAQKEIGVKIAKSLSVKIKSGEIKLILAAGIRQEVKKYFERHVLGLGVEVIFGNDMESYFRQFNEALRRTDILWTKPSELSFYSALSLPIIIAPPIGSQEEFNMRWLLKSGFGFAQENPKYVSQWLFDWLNQGYLAEAAMEGFVEGEKLGTLNIEKIISR